MRVRIIGTLIALAFGTFAGATAGASAAESAGARVTSLGTGSVATGWRIQGSTTCSASYSPYLYMYGGSASGGYFASPSDEDTGWSGIATFTLSKSGKRLATFKTEAYIYRGAGSNKATVGFGGAYNGLSISSEDDCVAAKRLMAAGVGSKASSYTLRLEGVSFRSDDQVAHTVKGGISKTINVKQMIRATATSTKVSGKSRLWNGKLLVFGKKGAAYKWLPAPKGTPVSGDPGSFTEKVSTKSASDGSFRVALPKSYGASIFLKVIANKWDFSSTYSRLKNGKIVNGIVPQDF